MKLPSNALIFLTALGVEFNVNFLNRCRVNALSGEQVSTLEISRQISVFENVTTKARIPTSNSEVVPIIELDRSRL